MFGWRTDSYTFSPKEYLGIGIAAFLTTIPLGIVFSVAISVLPLPINGPDFQLGLGYVLALVGSVLYFYRKELVAKAYYKPELVKARNEKLLAEMISQQRQMEKQRTDAYEMRLKQYRELIYDYSLLPNMEPTVIQFALAEIKKFSSYQETYAWSNSHLHQLMRIAIHRHQSHAANDEPRSSAEDFYRSRAWKILRANALHRWGDAPCACCNEPFNGKPKHVDHIKPRSKYPHLALEISNLQVMCEDCNIGKGNRHEVDWRTPEQKRRMGAA